MVSKARKTQVANNSIGVYGHMKKYTGKNPLVYIKHAVQFLLLTQRVVGYTQIRFDDNIPIIISPCLNKSSKDIWQQWDLVDFVSRVETAIYAR